MMRKKHKKILRSPQRETVRRRLFAVGALALVFFLCIAFVATIFLSYSKKFSINTIRISGNIVLAKEDIRLLVEKELSGRKWLLFSKRSSFLFPKYSIYEKLRAQYKRIASLYIKRVGFQGISIEIVEREPYYLWCGESYDKESLSEQCFFTDEKGYLFSDAPHYTGGLFTFFYGRLDPRLEVTEGFNQNPIGEGYVSAQGDIIGSFFLDTVEFNRIAFIMAEFEKLDATIQKLIIKEDKDVLVLTSRGFDVLFSLEQSDTEIIRNTESALEMLEKRNQVEDEKVLLHIDIRFGNKIFFKYSP